MAHGETSSRGRRRHVRYLLYSVRYLELRMMKIQNFEMGFESAGDSQKYFQCGFAGRQYLHKQQCAFAGASDNQ